MGGVSPRFRQDLSAVAADADGVACVDVEDPATGTRFRFYDFEYAMATQMDGRPLAEIVAWAAETYGMQLTEDGVQEFSRQLEGMGFLEAQAAADEAVAPVSSLVNDAVSQVTALPQAKTDDAARSSAYGDFSFGGGGEETTADAEWSSQDGARTATAPPVDDIAAGHGRRTDRDHPSEAPPSASGHQEFSESEQTGHWVPPFGTEHKRDPNQWASALNDTLRGAAEAPRTPEPPVGATLHGFGAAWVAPPGAAPAKAPSRASRPVPAPPPLAPLGSAGAHRFAAPPNPPTPTPSLPPLTPPPLGMPPNPDRVEMPATPPPITFERRQPPGPEQVVMAPFQTAAAEPAPPKQFRAPLEPPPSSKGSRVAVLIMVLLAVAGAAAYYLWTQGIIGGGSARHVRVMRPKPAAVYRWFDGTGHVVGSDVQTLAFSGGGRVTDVLPAGAAFAPGEIIARLQGAGQAESEVSRQRARLLFYEQMRDSMRAAANNLPELRQAEIKVGLKAELLAEAEASLAERVIRSPQAGAVVEALVKPGVSVQAGAAALKVSPDRLRGEFRLGGADREAAARLGFCRVEVIGQAPTASIAAGHGLFAPASADRVAEQSGGGGSDRFVDCGRTADDPAGPLMVEFPAGASVAVGQPLRLARARFDGVFPVSRTAVIRDTDLVYVASAGGMAEARAVTVSETSGDEALVTAGLDIGDAVIIDAPGDLRDGERIAIEK